MSLRLPQVSSSQCKRARAMLKWNPQDLASRTHMSVKTIEMFERNQQRLTKPENDEIVKAFHHFHIDFRGTSDVIFLAGTPSTATTADVADKKPIQVTLADGVTRVTLTSGQSHWGETMPGGEA